MSEKCVCILWEHTMENGKAVDKDIVGVYSNQQKGDKALGQRENISSNKEFLYTTQKHIVQQENEL